jgi:hypothetical protein
LRLTAVVAASMVVAGCSHTTEIKSDGFSDRGHVCYVDHVTSSGEGLKIFFHKFPAPQNYRAIFLLSRGDEQAPSSKYMIIDGTVTQPHRWVTLTPQFVYMRVGDTAIGGGATVGSGCTYKVQADDLGYYLDLSGSDGDLEIDSEYNERVRPL